MPWSDSGFDFLAFLAAVPVPGGAGARPRDSFAPFLSPSSPLLLASSRLRRAAWYYIKVASVKTSHQG